MHHLKEIALSLKDKMVSDSIPTYSAYSTLYIVLSLLPFSTLLVTLIRYTSLSTDVLVSLLENIIPSQFDELLSSEIIGQVPQISGSAIIVSLVVALWSASRGAYGLLKGLNKVYQVQENRNYIRRRLISMLYTLIFGILLIFTLILIIFGNRIQAYINSMWPLLGQITAGILYFRTLIVMVVMMLFFVLLYRVLPNQKGKIYRLIPGAVIASVGWFGFSFLFSLYIDYYAGSTASYGILTTVTLLIFWMYICICIILIGGSFNKWLEGRYFNKKKVSEPEEEVAVTKDFTEEEANEFLSSDDFPSSGSTDSPFEESESEEEAVLPSDSR